MFENFPYSNFHDLNTDWIINRIKQLLNEWLTYQTNINNQIADFENDVNNEISELNTSFDDFKTYVNGKLDEQDAEIQNFIDSLAPEMFQQYVYDWLDEHPEATTTVQDGSLTESKFSNSLKLKTIKDYVTPEMFGAVGDGIANDTNAVQQAINSGKPVIGTGIYKIGEPDHAYYYPVTISNDGIKVIGKFIDGRSYSTTSNNKDYGAFLINADNVEININIYNDNQLPVDDSDSNNLSDVAGYAVTLADGIKNAKVNIVCEHMNGVYANGLFYNSDINVKAESSAYPYAGICAIDSVIHINVNKCHRAFWGACNGSFIYIQSKNFYSTGDSSHVLVNAVKHEGIVYHCMDSVFEIIDTGSTDYNNDAKYLHVFNNIEEASIARLVANVIGDISNSDNGVFTCSTTGSGSAITGTLTIFNNMKVNYSNFSASRIYTGMDVRVFDSQFSKIFVDTSEKINLNLNGLNQTNGAVYFTNMNADSKIKISDYNAIVANSTFSVNSYHFFTVNNVFKFDPSKFSRCTVNNGTQYLNGNPVS